MIVALMREQARAHRAYLRWTAAVLTLAIAMAAYSAFAAAQQAAIEAHARAVYGLDGAWSASLNVDGTIPGIVSMPRDDLEAALADADAAGAETAASHEVAGVLLARDTGGAITDEDTWWTPYVRGTRGAVDWAALLLDGAPPGPGEIALGAEGARVLGVAIGDSIAVVADPWASTGPRYTLLGTLTVSGIARTGAQDRYEIYGAGGLVEWDDSFALEDAAAEARGEGDGLDTGANVSVGAQRLAPALEGMVETNPTLAWFGGNGADTGILVVLAVGAGVLVVGLIGMAFGVGRSQAQARTQWVATARVLGARRSSVAAATVAEVAVLGLASGLVGTGIAAFAMWLDWGAFAASHPDALLPDGVVTPAWMQAAFVGLGVAIAAILGAIPAFWAARVPPAAALKPITPVTQAEVSRRVSPAWIYGLWAATFAALILVESTDRGSDVWMWSTWTLVLIVAVVTVAALVEACRAIVTVLGRRLARSSRPWALAAGDGLLGHRRQAAVPAATLAIAMTTLAGIATWSALYSWGNLIGDEWTWTGVPGWPQLPTALAVAGEQSPGGMAGGPRLAAGALGSAVLVLAALAAFASASSATRMDDAARRALGLTGRDARLAAAARFGFPLTAGALLGTLAGTAIVVATYRGYASSGGIDPELSGIVPSAEVGPAWALAHVSHATVPGMVSLAITLGLIALGSLAAALMERTSRPTEVRRETTV